MGQCYRVVFESYDPKDPSSPLRKTIVSEGTLHEPTSVFDFSMGLDQQIDLIKRTQDCVLEEKILLLKEGMKCPECSGELKKCGYHASTFHDVLTDHAVKIRRWRCGKCNYEVPATIRTLFHGVQSAELIKIQSELGSDYSFRDVEKLLSLFSNQRRQINNHDRVKKMTEKVGESLDALRAEEKNLITIKPALELILNVDGGHVKTTEPELRSIEAMASVIYNPESPEKGSRHYAASSKGGDEFISNTIIAALKQGMNDKTHLTALCDGAENCWKVVDTLEPLVQSVTRILDWFHIAKKIENIALQEEYKKKLTFVKWHLWRGNMKYARVRLTQLIDSVRDTSQKEKLNKLLTYINNNKLSIVNYDERQKKGLVFTSQLAESTIESLINRRCKKQQKMRWSREGLNPILQIRATIASNEWNSLWKMAVMHALTPPHPHQNIPH
jgi:hypothetical protein